MSHRTLRSQRQRTSLLALAVAAALAGGCATSAIESIEPSATSGPRGRTPAEERIIAGVADLVLTDRAWPSFEAAQANRINTVADGAPVYAHLRTARPLQELAHPGDPNAPAEYARHPHLFLQVGDTDSMRIVNTCYVTMTPEEAKGQELVVPLAPMERRVGGIPMDCWLATVASQRSPKLQQEVRLAGFAGKFERWLPVPDILAVAPIDADLPGGSANYAAMLRAPAQQRPTTVARPSGSALTPPSDRQAASPGAGLGPAAGVAGVAGVAGSASGPGPAVPGARPPAANPAPMVPAPPATAGTAGAGGAGGAAVVGAGAAAAGAAAGIAGAGTAAASSGAAPPAAPISVARPTPAPLPPPTSTVPLATPATPSAAPPAAIAPRVPPAAVAAPASQPAAPLPSTAPIPTVDAEPARAPGSPPIAVATPVTPGRIAPPSTAEAVPSRSAALAGERLEAQLQALATALLGRRPSEAYFTDERWTNALDQRGQVFAEQAFAAAVFRGQTCSWARLRVLRRPGSANIADIERTGEPRDVNCANLR